MPHLDALSIAELCELKDEIEAEVAYCQTVSPKDAADSEAELQAITEEISARHALLALLLTPSTLSV